MVRVADLQLGLVEESAGLLQSEHTVSKSLSVEEYMASRKHPARYHVGKESVYRQAIVIGKANDHRTYDRPDRHGADKDDETMPEEICCLPD